MPHKLYELLAFICMVFIGLAVLTMFAMPMHEAHGRSRSEADAAASIRVGDTESAVHQQLHQNQILYERGTLPNGSPTLAFGPWLVVMHDSHVASVQNSHDLYGSR